MTSSPSDSGQGRRILVAEDDPSTNALLTAVLSKWDFVVESVTSGGAAYQALNSPTAPRLAILDWMMPEMSGYDVALKLAENIHHPIHVILLTAKTDRADVVKAMQAGVNDFLSKPVDFQALRARVESGFRSLDLRLALERERISNLQKGHLASLGVMASGAAHEINNPLTIVIGNVRKIKSELNTPSPDIVVVRERIDRIELQARRIGEIVGGLNELATEGPSEGLEENTAAHLEKSILSLCRTKFVDSGIDLQTAGFEERVIFHYRPQALGRAVLSLLQNSFDAVQGVESKWVRLSLEEDIPNEKIRIRVGDSGLGVPKELRGHLKEPFFTTKEIGKGAGLGLAVANGIIEGHQGSLNYNENATYTEFLITLLRRANRVADGASGRAA